MKVYTLIQCPKCKGTGRILHPIYLEWKQYRARFFEKHEREPTIMEANHWLILTISKSTWPGEFTKCNKCDTRGEIEKWTDIKDILK